MRCGAQRPHMHVEFVGQDLKRHPIMRWPPRLQRPRLVDDSFWRGPSAGIPCAERFERDTERRCALRLGQAEPSPDLSQCRYGRSSVTTMPSVRRRWKRMDCDEIRVRSRSEMGQKLREVFQLVGSDRSR